jgi:hypothetical protein
MFFFKFVGFLWSMPLSIFLWIFMGIFMAIGQVEKVKFTKDLLIIWKVKEKSWFSRKLLLGRGFVGFSFGNNIVYVDSERDLEIVLKHEKRHCQQYFFFGIFFLPLYFIESVMIYFFKKNLHPYFDNSFERDARSYSGEPLKIDWKNKYKRWPWW